MTPNPAKTKLEEAEYFENCAKVARDLADFVFAMELTQHAKHLREEHARELRKQEERRP